MSHDMAPTLNVPAPAMVTMIQAYVNSVSLILTCRCTSCGAPLFNAKSLANKLGPTCRRRPGGTA